MNRNVAERIVFVLLEYIFSPYILLTKCFNACMVVIKQNPVGDMRQVKLHIVCVLLRAARRRAQCLSCVLSDLVTAPRLGSLCRGSTFCLQGCRPIRSVISSMGHTWARSAPCMWAWAAASPGADVLTPHTSVFWVFLLFLVFTAEHPRSTFSLIHSLHYRLYRWLPSVSLFVFISQAEALSPTTKGQLLLSSLFSVILFFSL